MPSLQKSSSQTVPNGFTLLELMVVVLIMGFFVGLVSVIVQPDERSVLDVEAQRLARLLELVTAEARVSGASFAWSAEPQTYRFLHLTESGVWLEASGDDVLRPRVLPEGMHITSLLVENAPVPDAMRVEFPAYGQTTALTVNLEFGAASSMVAVSPLGAVSVLTHALEQP